MGYRQFKETSCVVFAFRSLNYLSYFESFLQTLVENKIRVHVYIPESSLEQVQSVQVLNTKNYGELLQVHPLKSGRNKLSRFLLAELRELNSVRHYLLHESASNFFLLRWISYLRFPFHLLVQLPGVKSLLANSWVGRLLEWGIRTWPLDSYVANELSKWKPQVVFASPGNMKRPQEIEFIQAANRLGILTVIPSLSWDNLTTKGTFNPPPKQLWVWNSLQKKYALDRHGFSEDQIHVVGSCFFDKWFNPKITQRPISRNLNGFQKRILYLGSSSNIAKDESSIVETLAKMCPEFEIMVRPHPENRKPFEKVVNTGNLKVISSQESPFPLSLEAQVLFYQELKQADVVIGVNTSGMLDAVIAGVPTIALLVPELAKTQKQSRHFNDMVESNAFWVIDSIEECVRQIKKENAFSEFGAKRIHFIEKYIRPGGVNVSASEFAFQQIANSSQITFGRVNNSNSKSTP